MSQLINLGLTVEVSDGTLDIDFQHQVQNPAIRGIKIQQIIDRTITPDVVNITLEAESYTAVSDVNNDGVDDFTKNTRTDASGGVYMQSGRINSSFLEYQINLPRDDAYEIAIRGAGTSSSTNSFRVSVDDGVDSVVQLSKDDTWDWKTVTDSNSGLGPYILSAGQHIIRIAKREANAKIDQLKISSSTAELVPNVSFSPSSLNFAEQAVGSVSNPQSVTLSNTGTASLNITSITTTGDFSESNDCNNLVAAGSSCQIDVSFSPSSAGSLTGTLVVDGDAVNTPYTINLAGSSQAVPGGDSGILFSHDFNDETLHTYTKDDLRTKWNNPKTVLKNNAVKIVKDPAPSGSRGNVMQVFHAANSVVHQNDSGSEWYMDIGAHDEMYLAYDVYFEGDAEFVNGGKLPCLISVDYWPHAGIPSDGTDDWSGIVVWKEDGLSSSYFYHANQPNNFGQIKRWKNGPEGQVFFKRGVWSRVEVYYKMNTPGKLDGSAQAWLNGVKVMDTKNIMYRMPSGEHLKIGQFRFLSAYNNKKIGPTSDQYIYFDNFIISKKPITHR